MMAEKRRRASADVGGRRPHDVSNKGRPQGSAGDQDRADLEEKEGRGGVSSLPCVASLRRLLHPAAETQTERAAMSSAMIPVPMAAAAQQLRSTQAHIGRCQVPAASQRLPARRERAFQRVSAVVGAGDRSEESRRQFLKIGSGVVVSTLLVQKSAWAAVRAATICVYYMTRAAACKYRWRGTCLVLAPARRVHRVNSGLQLEIICAVALRPKIALEEPATPTFA